MTMGRHSSIPPQLPPTTEDDRFLWLRLLRSRRVGPATFHRLLAEHGSVGAALEALPAIAAKAGVKTYAPCAPQIIKSELQTAQRFGATALFWGASDYPETLYDLPDAPPFLWAYGDINLLKTRAVALVGARNASSLGTRMAGQMAKDLGKSDHVVVSGLARGIDTAAHHAALNTGTIAVFPGGLDVIYPTENAHLARQISDQGLILSEHPMGLAPRPRHFPARNRIISGLSSAVVVIEAATKSGSMITAQNALDQGREVFAVPGHPIETRASGCNLLIRDGASLVRSADDVLAGLAPIAPAPGQMSFDLPSKPPPSARNLRETPNAHPASQSGLQRIAKLHQRILDGLSRNPISEDNLIRSLDAPTHHTASALTDLELSGQVLRTPNGRLIKQ